MISCILEQLYVFMHLDLFKILLEIKTEKTFDSIVAVSVVK